MDSCSAQLVQMRVELHIPECSVHVHGITMLTEDDDDEKLQAF